MFLSEYRGEISGSSALDALAAIEVMSQAGTKMIIALFGAGFVLIY